MIAIAGVLLLIVVVFAIAVVVSNPAGFDLSLFGATIPVTAGGVFFTGAGAMLVLILAAALLRRGVQRELRRRRQIKTLTTAASGTTRSQPAAPLRTRLSQPLGGAHAIRSKTATNTDQPSGNLARSEHEQHQDSKRTVDRRQESYTPREPGAPSERQAEGVSGSTHTDALATRPRAAGPASQPDAGPISGPDADPTGANAAPTASTESAERQALLEEVEELTGDSRDR